MDFNIETAILQTRDTQTDSINIWEMKDAIVSISNKWLPFLYETTSIFGRC